MYIKQDITETHFRDMFHYAGRSDNFSYEALGILFEYLENLSEDTGEPIELDIVALCCEYDEMSWQEVATTYRVDLEHCEDDEERIDAVRDFLQDNTSVCGEFTSDDGDMTFVFQVF